MKCIREHIVFRFVWIVFVAGILNSSLILSNQQSQVITEGISICSVDKEACNDVLIEKPLISTNSVARKSKRLIFKYQDINELQFHPEITLPPPETV